MINPTEIFEHLLNEEFGLCRIGVFRSGMEPDVQDQFDRVLASPVSTMRLHQELRKVGLRTSRTTLQLHRSRSCVCFS